MEALTLRDWLASLAVLFAAGSLWFALRRDRRDTQNTPAAASRPTVKTTINKTYYRDRWRSVQLHIVPPDIQPNFLYNKWRIYRARLMSPRGAVLARAENDDYASGVFFPEVPLREIAGKPQGRPQRFALEFFILFEGEERGQQAKFKVTYGPADESWRVTKTFTVTVPMDAHAAPPERAMEKATMSDTKVGRDFIFLTYASIECRKAIQKFEEMIALSSKKTEGIETNPLGHDAAGRVISFQDDGSAVAFEHESVYEAMRLGLHFAANTSRVFWPATSDPTAVARGSRLRQLCGMPENHAIKTRNARNRFEHLDEWLDGWTDPSPRPFLMVEGILLPHYPDQTRDQILEGSCVIYDAKAREVILFGKAFALAEMIDDLKDLQTHIGKGIDEVMKSWK